MLLRHQRGGSSERPAHDTNLLWLFHLEFLLIAFLIHVSPSNGFVGLHYIELTKAFYRAKVDDSSSLASSALFGDQQRALTPKGKGGVDDEDPSVEWKIYVDQSKASLERGAQATFDAVFALSPNATVRVYPAIFPKSKAKGPLVRCISNISGKTSLEVSNVDSVDKVFRILTRHMNLRIPLQACDCLKWKYKGNAHLESGKIALAIDAYNKALSLATEYGQQEGVLLLLRASAYLLQAEKHKEELKTSVEELQSMLPAEGSLKLMLREAAESGNPALSKSILQRLSSEGQEQESQFKRTQFLHGNMQYSLLNAAQDSLRATELLPLYSTSWLRAGEILSELWKLRESLEYYERAIALDESDTLQESLAPVIERLKVRQALLDRARAFGWPEDTLRLALDVAG